MVVVEGWRRSSSSRTKGMKNEEKRELWRMRLLVKKEKDDDDGTKKQGQ
jgi:hypothetical protein